MVKLRKIIAYSLTISMLIPNIKVGAIENTLLNDSNVEVNIVTNQEVETSEEHDRCNYEEQDNFTSEEEFNEENINEENIIEEEQIIHIEEDKADDMDNSFEEKVSLIGTKYETVQYGDTIVNTISALSVSEEEYEREEFRLKAEALNNYSVLKNKTNDNYEIAMANSDSSYTFVGSATSYDEAMDILEKEVVQFNDGLEEESVPVIINEYGQVVYATNYMIRFIKNVNGVIHLEHNDDCYKKDKVGKYILDQNGNKVLRDNHPATTTNIYTDSTLRSAYTYINQGYVEDAPVIESNDKAAKVQVNGYTGWVNGNYQEKYVDANGTEHIYNWSDYVIVPITRASNPSYYIVENDILYHYISYNLETSSNGTKIAIGAAPSYLKSNIKYLSYDGNYFYDGSDIQNGLNVLVNDLKSGNKNNSVNRDNPHYTYYQYLPFRSKTIYTATELDSYIEKNTKSNSKLRGIGQALKDAENSYGVNAAIMLGIAINESAWGMSSISQSKNNIFGLNAVDTAPGLAANEFASVNACINDFSKNWISAGYSDPADWRYFGGYVGNKNLGANVKYASDPFWGEKATKYAFDIDLQLSGSIKTLKDTNVYQIAMYEGANQVTDKDGKLLYNVDNSWAFYGNTFIITSKDTKFVNGNSCYEIYGERYTPVRQIINGVEKTVDSDGSYNWSDRGYVRTSGIKMINNQKDINADFQIVAGDDRYKTAVELSKSKYDASETVIIVNSSAVIDGVTASPLAYNLNAPILLTYPQTLGATTKNEISRLNAKKVILVGSEGIINNSVVNELKAMGITDITRLAGADRYGTALAVAQYIDNNCYDVSDIFMVYGMGEADAVSISSISGINKMPIILTRTEAIPGNVYSWLKGEGLNNAYVIGSEGIISNNVLNNLNSITNYDISNNRIGGSDRYETNAKIIDKFFSKNPSVIYCTEAKVLIDTLTAGPIAARDGAPIYIIRHDLTVTQKPIAEKMTAQKIVQVGRTVPTVGVQSLRDLIKKYCI